MTDPNQDYTSDELPNFNPFQDDDLSWLQGHDPGRQFTAPFPGSTSQSNRNAPLGPVRPGVNPSGPGPMYHPSIGHYWPAPNLNEQTGSAFGPTARTGSHGNSTAAEKRKRSGASETSTQKKRKSSNLPFVCDCTYSPTPPRPRNAFLIYRAEKVNLVNRSNPNASLGEKSRKISAMWSVETPAGKAKYEKKQQEEKKKHEETYKNYKYQPGIKKSKKHGIRGRCTCGSYEKNQKYQEYRNTMSRNAAIERVEREYSSGDSGAAVIAPPRPNTRSSAAEEFLYDVPPLGAFGTVFPQPRTSPSRGKPAVDPMLDAHIYSFDSYGDANDLPSTAPAARRPGNLSSASSTRARAGDTPSDLRFDMYTIFDYPPEEDSPSRRRPSTPRWTTRGTRSSGPVVSPRTRISLGRPAPAAGRGGEAMAIAGSIGTDGPFDFGGFDASLEDAELMEELFGESGSIDNDDYSWMHL